MRPGSGGASASYSGARDDCVQRDEGRRKNRSDVNNDGLKVRFDDERYLRYAPIRLPWTTCVRESSPAGVAGALLNQTHVFDDLMLFIDAREKRMFEAIDGRRSVSEIFTK